MKISIASDHGGTKLKEYLVNYLKDRYEVIDLSPTNEPTDDYPDFALVVGQSISNKESEMGILICRSGIGMCIAANKIKGVYCAKVDTLEEAKTARAHNGANIIAINGDTDEILAREMIDTFLHVVALDDPRHQRRYDKIIKIEEGKYNEL